MSYRSYRRDKSREPSYPVTEDTTLLPFLLATLKGKSRNNVKSLLARKLVAVDNKPESRFDTPLHAGQTVTILSVSAPFLTGLPFELLYEDEHLIAVNKPAGLLSVGNERERVRTAYRMVSDYVKTQNMDNRIYVLHRLDRETSGVLIFARDPETQKAFQEHWNECVAKRGYYAVVEGVPQPDHGTVTSHLIETSTHLMFSGAPGLNSRRAVTHYRTLRQGQGYALLDVNIDTGRKNQIRVHMKDLGHPVAGDKQYGGRTNPLGRLCLHSYELSLTHPLTGKTMSFVARMPKEFKKLFRAEMRPVSRGERNAT